jgi:hypothetical protein
MEKTNGNAGKPARAPQRMEDVWGGWYCRISDRNALLLRQTYARRNPEGLGPDELVNEILKNWFRLMRMSRG